MSSNAAFETAPNPEEPFDFNAVPSTFYYNAESVGSMPVRQAVEQGLDILRDNLAAIILAVGQETGVDEDEQDGAGFIEPEMPNGADGPGGMNGGGMMGGPYDQGGFGAGSGAAPGGAPYGGYGAGGYGGSGMSPLRR